MVANAEWCMFGLHRLHRCAVFNLAATCAFEPGTGGAVVNDVVADYQVRKSDYQRSVAQGQAAGLQFVSLVADDIGGGVEPRCYECVLAQTPGAKTGEGAAVEGGPQFPLPSLCNMRTRVPCCIAWAVWQV